MATHKIGFISILLLLLFPVFLMAQNNAINFDGVDDNIQVSHSSIFDLTSNYTIEAWVKLDPANYSGNNTIVSKGHGNGVGVDDETYMFQITAGVLRLYMYQGPTSYWYTGTASIPSNTWTHVACTYDGVSQILNFYINGVLDRSIGTINQTPAVNTEPLIIGRQGYDLGCACNHFNGEMDELKIWNRTLCGDEIQNNMNCEISGGSSGLVANYHFNQGTGGANNAGATNLSDFSGYGHDGTLTGFTLNTSTSNWITSTASVSGVCGAFRDINLTGAGNTIVDGSTTPTFMNWTDFGSVSYLSGTSTRTFTIENTGGTPLTPSAVNITGADAAMFSASAITPAGPIASGASATFDVTFTAGSLGFKDATITVVNDDCDETLYDFSVQGRGVSLGAALNFNGTTNFLQTGDIDLAGSFTLEAWVKTFSGGQYCILSKGDGGGVDENYIMSIVNGKIGLYINYGGVGNGAWTYSNTTIPNNTWCHVAVSYDNSTHTNKFYLNGVLDGTNVRASASPAQNNSNMLIGKQGDVCQCNYFSGDMDELRIWNRALEQCEIQSYMNCEIAFIPPDLVSSYSFNIGLNGIEGATNFGYNLMNDWPYGIYPAQLNSFAYVGSTSNWIAPGGVVSGTGCNEIPEITVNGGGFPIAGDSSNVPSVVNNTDFGNSTIGSNQDNLFAIVNSGGLLTFIPNPTRVVIDGSSDFTLQADAAAFVNPASFTNFTIRFTPSSAGIKTAKVRIMSNDCDEPIYTFNIQGTGVTAPPGDALASGGTVEYIPLNNSSDFNFIQTDSFTVEFYAAFNSTEQDAIFSKLTNAAPYNGYEIGIQNGRINFFMCSNFSTTNYLSVTTVTPFNNNIWNHIAIVYPGIPDANKIKIYVNGVSQALTIDQNTLTGSISNSNMAHIGARGNAGQSLFYTGSLDELRIWDRVLCASEITSFKDCEKNGSETGLIACYHFNQGSHGADNSGVTTLIDASGGDNNGILNGYILNGFVSNWRGTGGVATGTVCGAHIQPEIDVKGQGASIISGDNTPNVADYTDFGNIQVGNLGDQNYYIDNSGAGTLILSNTPRVSISGSADFIINVQPSSSSASTGQTLTFNVRFSPTSTGVKTAVITIESNDCSESVYTFTIQGTGVVPDIQLHSDGINYASGDSYNLPSIVVGGASDDIYIEIQNTVTNSSLNLTGTPKVILSGPHASDFFLTTVPITTPVLGGSSTGFFIKFFPSALGSRFGVLTIPSDDPDEPSFVLNIRGIGLEPPEIDVTQGALNVPTGVNYDFGNYVINNSNSGKTFTIHNLSVDGKLALNGTPKATLSLADANQFAYTITSLPDTLLPGSTVDFNVRFLPTSAGNKTALLTIPNNDPDEAPYLIFLIGKGVVSGDLDSNGTISAGEITGDTSGNGSIEYPSEVTGDINGNGSIGSGEVAGDNDGDGIINNGETAGNTNGNGVIDNGEITGDINGSGVIEGNEFAGDNDGDGILDPTEIIGDVNGNGTIAAPEVQGDINGDGIADPDPGYVLIGKGIIVSNYVSRYSVQPELPATSLPAYYTYAWVYSDTTLYMIKDTSRYFMDVVAHNHTNNGVLSCIIYRFGVAYDTLDFSITVNRNYINIAELAELTSECAHVANPENDCEESFIDYFKLRSINYDGNGCVRGGYQDLTASGYTTDLEMGFTYTVELKPNKLLFFPNPQDPSQNDTTIIFYAVWIDYNNDGDFEDFAEYVKNGDSKSASTKLINITIANNELYEGSRRMRVGMKTGSGFASSDACGINAIGSSGEIEDYLVTLVPMGALQAPNFLSPNNDGNNDLFSVKGVNMEKARILTVMNKTGAVVYQEEGYGDKELWGGKDNNGELLPKGTYYYIFKNGSDELKSFLEIDY